LDQQDHASVIRDLNMASVQYSEILGPWEVRRGEDLGIIGAALPKSYFVRTSQARRLQIVTVAFGSVILVITTGFYLSRRITRPLLNVVRASTRVAQGDLDVRVKPSGNDEVSILAHSFNQMVAGLREVTERRLREIELMKALEHERDLRVLKSRFISMVSHEFRTPLATILSSAEFLQNFGQEVPFQKRQKHLERIQHVVTNMTQLLEEVLFIGRSEAKRLEFNPIPVDLEAYCREIVDEIQATVSKTHSIQFVCHGSPMDATIDPKLLRLALGNLLSNAVKYSPDGGLIHFGLYRRNGNFIFRIADKGIGIPLKDQAHLFETFHRGANVGSISGSGLGLYVAKMAVELHDGRITFKSQEGIGTTFALSIPCVEPMEMNP